MKKKKVNKKEAAERKKMRKAAEKHYTKQSIIAVENVFLMLVNLDRQFPGLLKKVIKAIKKNFDTYVKQSKNKAKKP